MTVDSCGGYDNKPYRSQIPQSDPIPARPRVNPRTHLTRLYPSGSSGSGFTLRSWSAAVALHDQSPAPAGNTKALIGPRRALIPLVSAQTDGLLVGGCVGDAPLLRCMLLSVSGGEGTRSSEMMGTKWVVMRVVSAAQGELTTLTDKLWTAILTPSSFRSTGAFWGTLWWETAAIPHTIWTFFQPFPKNLQTNKTDCTFSQWQICGFRGRIGGLEWILRNFILPLCEAPRVRKWFFNKLGCCSDLDYVAGTDMTRLYLMQP